MDVNLLKEEDRENPDEMELEDLDEEETEKDTEEDNGETNGEETEKKEETKENPMPFEGAVDNITGKLNPYVDAAKQKGEQLLDKGISAGLDFHKRHKGKFYHMYNSVMDLKDDMHYARKEAGGGWAGIKSAAGVIGDRIKGTETYQKFANSSVGQWISKKKEEHDKKKEEKARKKEEEARKKAEEAKIPKEPGFFSKAWDKVKTGAGAAKDAIANTKFGRWFEKKKEEHAEKKAEKQKKKEEEKAEKDKLKAEKKAEKERLKAEKERIKAEKKAEEERIKAEKKAEEERIKAEKGPGFFSRTWDKIKTGAGAVKDAVANTKFGKQVSKVAGAVSGEVGKAKEWVGQQVEWGKEMLNKGKEAWNQIKDDFSDNEAERRIRNRSQQDETYRERLEQLIDELKNNEGIKEIQNSVESGEIDDITDEMEKGKKDDESTLGKIGERLEDNADSIQEKAADHFSMTDTGGNILGGAVSGVGTVLKVGGEIKNTVQNYKKSKAVQESVKGVKNEDLQQVAGNISLEAKKQAAGGVFNALEDVVNGAENVGKNVPGMKILVKTAGTVLKGALKGGKALVTSGMDKQSRKAGIKHALGGVEVYKKLKAKYKMRAPEMRYAIRRVLGMRSEDDVASADKAVLSGKVSNMKEGGDKNAEALMNASGAKTRADLYRQQGGKAQIERRAY